MKAHLKVLWFKAEDKALEYSKLDIFKVISKLFYTAALLIMCTVVFAIFGIHAIWTLLKDRYTQQVQTKNNNNNIETVDEYSADDEYVLPDKVEPGELDPVERIRKWM
tara:strand:- start:748 stop:1071 length:324 start_codon:yes stop_codon:yes gene_type:complete